MNNSVPVSSGIGTGKAQVYSFDRTNRALENALGYAMQEKEYQRKVQAAKEREQQRKKEDVYSQQLKDLSLDLTKVRKADREVLISEANNIKKTFEGKWEDIANGGEKALEYMDAIQQFQIDVANSMETAEKEKELLKDMQQNEELYTTNMKKDFYESVNTPKKVIGSNGYLDGVFRVPEVGDVAGDVVKNMKPMFYKDQYRTETDETISALEGDVFVSDEESLAAFKEQLKLNPELQLRIRLSQGLEYDDELTDEQIKQVHDAAKARLPQYKKIIQTSKKDDSDKGSLSEQGITLNENKTSDGKTRTTLTVPNLTVTGTVEYEKDGEKTRQVIDGANINDIYVKPDGTVHGYVVMQGEDEKNTLKEVKLIDSAALNSLNSQIKKKSKGKGIIDIYKEYTIDLKTEPENKTEKTNNNTDPLGLF